MKIDDNIWRIDPVELELQARRMQAQTMARGMRGVGRWVRRHLG